MTRLRRSRSDRGPMKKTPPKTAFKIDADVMSAIRKFAREDRRTITATIEKVLRERFCATTGYGAGPIK